MNRLVTLDELHELDDCTAQRMEALLRSFPFPLDVLPLSVAAWRELADLLHTPEWRAAAQEEG